MRRRAVLCLMLAATVPAGAEEVDVCSDLPDDRVLLESWSAEVGGEDSFGIRRHHLAYTIRNATERSLRMIDASAVFKDGLGKVVVRLAVPRDIQLAPGERYTHAALYRDLLGINRLVTQLDPRDVRAAVCLRAVLYEDGSVERF